MQNVPIGAPESQELTQGGLPQAEPGASQGTGDTGTTLSEANTEPLTFDVTKDYTLPNGKKMSGNEILQSANRGYGYSRMQSEVAGYKGQVEQAQKQNIELANQIREMKKQQLFTQSQGQQGASQASQRDVYSQDTEGTGDYIDNSGPHNGSPVGDLQGGPDTMQQFDELYGSGVSEERVQVIVTEVVNQALERQSSLQDSQHNRNLDIQATQSYMEQNYGVDEATSRTLTGKLMETFDAYREAPDDNLGLVLNSIISDIIPQISLARSQSEEARITAEKQAGSLVSEGSPYVFVEEGEEATDYRDAQAKTRESIRKKMEQTQTFGE